MKKKLLSLLILTTFITTSSFSYVAAKPKPDKWNDNPQKSILKKWKDNTKEDKDFKIHWNKKNDIPDFITGNLSEDSINSKSKAKTFLKQHKGLFKIKDGEFKVLSVEKDDLGKTHYRAILTIDNIPVYGSEVLVHTDEKGFVYAVNGKTNNKFKNRNWSDKVNITTTSALSFAEEDLNLEVTDSTYISNPTTDLYLYEHKNKLHVVYLVKLQFLNPYVANWQMFVDAETGEVIDKYNAATYADGPLQGTGTDVFGQTLNLNTYLENGVYYLYDATKPMDGKIITYDLNYQTRFNAPGTMVSDSDNNFNSQQQRAAVSAHYNFGKVYDFFKNEYNRNSFDNKGATIISSVHCAGDNGERNWNNAAWVGTQMVFGDGDGNTFANLSGALDVVAHEFTHAVTQYSSNLEYRFQSGALNEAMSDILAIACEGEAGDWYVGEDCYTPNTPGDGLRNIQDPTESGLPAHMNDYKDYPLSYDEGGVHINCGIILKAGYNIGSRLGIEKMGEIFYRANTVYYTSTSDFMDARTGAIQAANDLYGNGSTESQVVAESFAAVGLGENTTPSEDTFEPNDSMSNAHGPLESGKNYDSFISSSRDVDYYYFNTAANGNISISLSNLAGDYDVYLYDSTGSQLAKSEKGGTSNENISFNANTNGKFYIKVSGYNGASSTTKPYNLTVTYPTSGSQAPQWYYEDNVYETPHNYPNNYDNTQQYSKAGATKVAVHFSRLETEKGYDYVYIKDKQGNVIARYDGNNSNFWVEVDGDTVNITIVSDQYVTDYGYKIDQVKYYK